MADWPPDLFVAALAASDGLPPTPANLERVARQTSAEAARWAFGQWDLRRRARAKFPRAEQMLFVREALEQATPLSLARWRAERFPKGEHVADLTCGIGGDLIALAERGPVLGFELDRERARCAKHNLTVHRLDGEILEQDSLAWLSAQPPGSRWLADPARRVEGRRTLDPSGFQPDPTVLAELGRRSRLAALKLSPLLPDPFLHHLGGAVEFVSERRECREALVWFGDEAAPAGTVRAVHVESGRSAVSGPAPLRVPEVDAYLHVADPAWVRAHALGSLGVPVLGDAPAYLTSSRPLEVPEAEDWLVLTSLPYRRKDVSKLPYRLESVRTSGLRLDAEAERKALRRTEGDPATLFLYPVGASIRATICKTP